MLSRFFEILLATGKAESTLRPSQEPERRKWISQKATSFKLKVLTVGWTQKFSIDLKSAKMLHLSLNFCIDAEMHALWFSNTSPSDWRKNSIWNFRRFWVWIGEESLFRVVAICNSAYIVCISRNGPARAAEPVFFFGEQFLVGQNEKKSGLEPAVY